MLDIKQHYTKDMRTLDDLKRSIQWSKRTVVLKNKDGKIIFQQKDVEAPEFWSDRAVTIVASKYFYGELGSKERENSIWQLVKRVCETIAMEGEKQGYFVEHSTYNFTMELMYICLHQIAAFNSPVWFNVGLQNYGVKTSETTYVWDSSKNDVIELHKGDDYRPQSSACFIQSVEDNMDSIMALANKQAMLFKNGSGTGTDFSTLRSSREKLSGGGKPSGPLSFITIFDRIADVVKSGGKTRRAAAMVSLQASHPDIMEFIKCKTKEEYKVESLLNSGFTDDPETAYAEAEFQNANLSVRLTDKFMEAVKNDEKWDTISVTTGEVVETYNAKEIYRAICEGAHTCGDPGVQFDTTINKANTCKESGKINASNPCSEFMFLDDSACNLASINLMKVCENKEICINDFNAVIWIMIIAQDILIDMSSYPSAEICRNSHNFRPLGLGYANLGALLMSWGIPYDSNKARKFTSHATQFMTCSAYLVSAVLAVKLGPFTEYTKNKKYMQSVVKAMWNPKIIHPFGTADEVLMDFKAGYRNAQVTLLAPCGTIGFMMDCDTTGIEPEISLVKYKTMVDGSVEKIINQTVYKAFRTLGYDEKTAKSAISKIEKGEVCVEDLVNDDELAVFDCAFIPEGGKRCIHHSGHVKMMAAVQPYLSGAISKTVNIPKDISVESIMDIYMTAWESGLKSIALYRDGSKKTQPVSTTLDEKEPKTKILEVMKPYRKRLPETRNSVTHKFTIGKHEGYLTVGLYSNGEVGEIFITMAKEGSTIKGIMDVFSTSISMGLQYGVPLNAFVEKFKHCKFDPSGMTSNAHIKFANSVIDYIFKWIEFEYLEEEVEEKDKEVLENSIIKNEHRYEMDAPACSNCGAITVRNGNCHRCHNCGESMGCS